MKKYITLFLMIGGFLLSSCDDFLQREPLDFGNESIFLKSTEDMAYFANTFYSLFPSNKSYMGGGPYRDDENSDNQTSFWSNSNFYPGVKEVPKLGDNSAWKFTTIRQCNYFINLIRERIVNKEITGTEKEINHYLGEVYFFRAYDYYRLLTNYGDVPIIEEELPDDIAIDDDLDDVEPVGDEAQLYEHFRVVVDRGQEMMRVDKYLFDRLTNASRNRIQKSAEAGFVMANNKPVKSSYKVKPMDVITIMMDRPRYENEVIPEDIPLNIVYEDKYLMIVNKPAGLVVHPGHGNYHGTLVNAIAWHMKDNPDYDANDPHVGLVHRIDKDTSGLLVIAKTPDAKTNLGIQFFNKTTKRRYRALVWGIVEQDEGTIIGNIGRNPKDRMQMTVLPDDQGKHAVTHYRVLERLGYVTLVECILETGRTHQIRVHMKHIGHVLFNDERYGGHEILKGTHFSKYKQFVNNCFDTCPRQALHAMTLGFVHPATGEEMYFTSEMPDDMTQLIDKWRGYISNRDLE